MQRRQLVVLIACVAAIICCSCHSDSDRCTSRQVYVVTMLARKDQVPRLGSIKIVLLPATQPSRLRQRLLKQRTRIHVGLLLTAEVVAHKAAQFF